MVIPQPTTVPLTGCCPQQQGKGLGGAHTQVRRRRGRESQTTQKDDGGVKATRKTTERPAARRPTPQRRPALLAHYTTTSRQLSRVKSSTAGGAPRQPRRSSTSLQTWTRPGRSSSSRHTVLIASLTVFIASLTVFAADAQVPNKRDSRVCYSQQIQPSHPSDNWPEAISADVFPCAPRARSRAAARRRPVTNHHHSLPVTQFLSPRRTCTVRRRACQPCRRCARCAPPPLPVWVRRIFKERDGW
jgi:hypothetical protein